MATSTIDRIISPQMTQIFTERKTTTAAGWYISDGTFTLENRALIYIYVKYQASGGVFGIGISDSDATDVKYANILNESDTASYRRAMTVLSAGTYSVWLKCGSAGNGNTVTVYKICDIVS